MPIRSTLKSEISAEHNNNVEELCKMIEGFDTKSYSYNDKVKLFRAGLGLLIETVRKSRQLSINDVSRLTKINKFTLALIERGAAGSDYRDIKKILSCLSAYSHFCQFTKSLDRAFDSDKVCTKYFTKLGLKEN